MSKEEAFNQYMEKKNEKPMLNVMTENSERALLFLAEIIKYARQREQDAFHAGWLAHRDHSYNAKPQKENL